MIVHIFCLHELKPRLQIAVLPPQAAVETSVEFFDLFLKLIISAHVTTLLAVQLNLLK